MLSFVSSFFQLAKCFWALSILDHVSLNFKKEHFIILFHFQVKLPILVSAENHKTWDIVIIKENLLKWNTSHKKEHIWVNANEVDEPRAYYEEWIKAEREKQIPYFNTYIWNLVWWYWWTHLQHSNGDADRENRLRDTEQGDRKERVGQEQHENICTTICKVDSQWKFAAWLRKLKPGLYGNLEGWDGVGGGREVQEGGAYVYLWLIHVDVWKNQHNILKQLSSN